MPVSSQRRSVPKRKVKQQRGTGAAMLVGTDPGTPMKSDGGTTLKKLGVSVKRIGLPAIDAIRAAGVLAQVAMKAGGNYASVTEGKFTDFIAVKGDVSNRVALLQDVDTVIRRKQAK